MAIDDYVQVTLDFLDTNWNTTNFSPKPTLVDGDEMRLYGGGRARNTDVVNENIITVDSSPQATFEPVGTEYDHQFRVGVGVQIEGYHQDGGGQLADKDAFDSMKAEARRAILTERLNPTTQAKDLFIEQENDDSAAMSHNDANYFRYLFDCWYEGFEQLP